MTARAQVKRGMPILKTILIVIAFAPAVFALGDASELPFTTRSLGVLMWFLSILPSILYVSRPSSRRRPLPFIETISFIYGLYYALPIALGEVNRAWRITVDPRDGYDVPMQLVFLGWMTMMAAYAITGYFLKPRKRPNDFPWRPHSLMKWGSAFLISGVLVNALRALAGDNVSVGGVIQLFVSLQWLGIGLLVVLSRRGELSRAGKAILIGGFLAAVATALAQGNISPVVLLCVVVAFALWAGKPVIGAGWLMTAAAAILMAVALRGVIKEFRMTAWYGTQQFTQTQKVKLMLNLLTQRIDEQGISGALSVGGEQTAQRSANMDMFADVIRRTPSEIPYWKGETYYSLIGAAIPRFLWPDKPVKGLGQAFGHRYRYIDPTNLSTAINLPILVEFYVNFGATAVMIGMLVVGVIYGVVDGIVNRPGQSLVLSMIGLTLLLPLLLIESDFSLVFGGLPLSGAALWGIWVLMRRSALGSEVRTKPSARARARPTSIAPRIQPRSDRPALPSG